MVGGLAIRSITFGAHAFLPDTDVTYAASYAAAMFAASVCYIARDRRMAGGHRMIDAESAERLKEGLLPIYFLKVEVCLW